MGSSISRTKEGFCPRPDRKCTVFGNGTFGSQIVADIANYVTMVLNPRRKREVVEDTESSTYQILAINDMRGEIEDSQSNHFDTVCAICDNGGVLICCEGKCFRSFHATPDTDEAVESICETLSLTPDQLKETYQHQFRCKNCLYGQHQCFLCGQLGSSKYSSAEVFRCRSRTCGHFYHPKCVAKRLHPNDESKRKNLQEKIGAGEPFKCPAHKCDVCKQTENEKVKDLQFAVCRRCPTSYHRKCLPREIVFDNEVGGDDIPRAWDSLLRKNRAMIYCLKHEIDEDIGTPARILIFPDIGHGNI